MEVDIDVASSSVASTVVGMVQGATKSLVVDMGIVLEGHTNDELPERLLGSVRFSRVDMSPQCASRLPSWGCTLCHLNVLLPCSSIQLQSSGA